jgi:hypothetical protein
MSIISQIQQATNILDIRAWLGMSSREMAAHIRPMIGKQAHVSGQYIRLWRRARVPMAAAQLEDLRAMIAEKINKVTGREDLSVEVRRNRRRMRVIVRTKCSECRRTFSPMAVNIKRCERCRAIERKTHASHHSVK